MKFKNETITTRDKQGMKKEHQYYRRPYTDEEESEIIALYREGKTKSHIAKIVGRTQGSIKWKLKVLRQAGLLTEIRPINWGKGDTSLELAPTDLELFTETELKLEREILWTKYNDGRAKRILVISDLHIPFHNHNFVKEALKEKADLCIVAGDFLDLYSVSTFRKNKLIPLQREFSDGTSILRIISSLYPNVVMLLANHESRLLKILQNKFYEYPEIVQYFKDASNVLSRMAQDYGNVDVVNSWWCKIGQAIIAHPDYYSKIRSKTVQNSYEFFTSFGEEFQAILNAHTHHLSKIVYFGKLLIEIPCLCYIMDYMLTGHRYNAEWVQGYAILELDKDGNVERNKTNPHWLK
jgi:transposase-like protein